MSQTRYLCRLKNGSTGCLMMFIRSFTLKFTISVRDNAVIVKKAAYVILELTCDWRKEVLPLAIGENESAEFRLNALALNELKMRGVQDVMIISVYDSHGPQHLEIRRIKRHEIFYLRPKDDYFQCSFRR